MSAFKKLVIGQEVRIEGVKYVVDEIKGDDQSPGVYLRPVTRRFVTADCIDEGFDWGAMESLTIGDAPKET